MEIGIHLPDPEGLQTLLKLLDGSDGSLDQLDSQLARRVPGELRVPLGGGVSGVVERDDSTELGKHFLQNLKTLRYKVPAEEVDSREPPSGFREALHQPHRDGVTPDAEHDGNLSGCLLHTERDARRG